MTARWVRYTALVATVERQRNQGIITDDEFAAKKLELRLRYLAGEL